MSVLDPPLSCYVNRRLNVNRFYYVDERTDSGGIAGMDRSGEAHAEHFINLVDGESQGPWLQTFVKDKGYKAFNEIHE